MDGGCDIVRVDIDVSVRPMQGVWECCDPPRIEKQKKGGAVILKGSQSVMFCKELPSTSKATSGPYKDFDYNISSVGGTRLQVTLFRQPPPRALLPFLPRCRAAGRRALPQS